MNKIQYFPLSKESQDLLDDTYSLYIDGTDCGFYKYDSWMTSYLDITYIFKAKHISTKTIRISPYMYSFKFDNYIFVLNTSSEDLTIYNSETNKEIAKVKKFVSSRSNTYLLNTYIGCPLLHAKNTKYRTTKFTSYIIDSWGGVELYTEDSKLYIEKYNDTYSVSFYIGYTGYNDFTTDSRMINEIIRKATGYHPIVFETFFLPLIKW